MTERKPMMPTTTAERATRRPRAAVWRVGVLAVFASVVVVLGCPNSRLTPVSFGLAARMQQQAIRTTEIGTGQGANGNAPATGTDPTPDPPDPVQTFVENFVDPLNTVTAFLVAIAQQDTDRLRRTLTTDSQLRRRLPIDAFAAEPWRWSALRCTVWKYTGIGPAIAITTDHAWVVLQPPPGESYHIRFHVIRPRRGEAWRIYDFKDSTEPLNFSERDLVVTRIDRQFTQLTLGEEQAAAADAAELADTAEMARRLVTALQTNALASLVPNETMWRESLALSLRPTFTREVFTASRQELARTIRAVQEQLPGSTFLGSFDERRYVVAETASVICQLRMCFGRPGAQPPWSIRVELRSIDGNWYITDLDYDAVWPHPDDPRLRH